MEIVWLKKRGGSSATPKIRITGKNIRFLKNENFNKLLAKHKNCAVGLADGKIYLALVNAEEEYTITRQRTSYVVYCKEIEKYNLDGEYFLKSTNKEHLFFAEILNDSVKREIKEQQEEKEIVPTVKLSEEEVEKLLNNARQYLETTYKKQVADIQINKDLNIFTYTFFGNLKQRQLNVKDIK